MVMEIPQEYIPMAADPSAPVAAAIASSHGAWQVSQKQWQHTTGTSASSEAQLQPNVVPALLANWSTFHLDTSVAPPELAVEASSSAPAQLDEEMPTQAAPEMMPMQAHVETEAIEAKAAHFAEGGCLSREELRAKHDITDDQLLQLNEELLTAIGKGDVEAYEELCDPLITCFEPEARGHLVEGINFHKYYFDYFGSKTRGSTCQREAPAPHTTLTNGRVRRLGDFAAVVCFCRLVQHGLDVAVTEETRVWEFRPETGGWRLVHFHRSRPGRGHPLAATPFGEQSENNA